MRRPLAALLVLIPMLAVLAADSPLVESFDTNKFTAPKQKGTAELVEGKTGKAVRFSFEKDSSGVFFTSRLRGTPEWDKADGLSFWVKGDGTDGFGGLHCIWNDDFAARYDVCFPVKGTEWTKVVVPWADLIPVLPGKNSNPLNVAGPNKPSQVSAIWIGKWWYWKDYPATTFALDELRLEPKIERDAKDHKPAGDPLARVAAKVRAGKPITVVTMGDSLTDYRHWANRTVSWPNLLRDDVKKVHKSDVTIVNPAIGGTQLRQNLVLIPRWLATTPEPDLVTICFGANDWDSGMRKGQFHDSCVDAVDRVRRLTNGKADVLLLPTIPGVNFWETRAELAEDIRKTAKDRNAGLADTEAAFLEAGKAGKEKLFVDDKVHLSPLGHEIVAKTVLKALENAK